jgi:23S rRNA pseudouridine1911/1915/1917 synthase
MDVIQQPLSILYEDNHLIAVNKRPSDIVQGDKTGDKPLSEIVKDYIKKKYQKPGDVFLGVAHRIDRPVSGVVLFARTSKALERINEMFRDKKIQKTYWAVVKNRPPQNSGLLVNYLYKNEKLNKSFVTDATRKDASLCELEYKIIASSDTYFLLEINPHTGRHHQIRVQLAHMGCPIKGDLKYGFDRSNKDASIHLHARKISFIHPVKNEPIEIIAPPPDEVLWNYFLKEVG